jgi:AcrR family transcriptional regulator
MADVKTRAELQAADTRRAIVAAAADLFERDGYAATTVGDIARAAGVVPQTLYNAIGPKSAVLSAVLDLAAAGPNAPRSVPEFMSERAAAISDAASMVEDLAEWFAEVMPRVAAITRVIREAAAVDPAVAELEERRASQRLANYGRAAAALAALPGARPLARADVAAVIWSVGHPQTYAHLTGAEGWSIERYRAWVAGALAAALVEPTP